MTAASVPLYRCPAGSVVVRAAISLGLAGAIAGLVAVRRRFVVVRVAGASMAPTYRTGDRVLVRRVAGRALRRGQVVVFDLDPRRRSPLATGLWQIKRVAAVPGDPVPGQVAPAVHAGPGTVVPPGRLVVLGDGSADSRDSRHWGYLSADRVLGVVVKGLSTPRA
jgi:signal peptidase I